jgi:hypothetical protein
VSVNWVLVIFLSYGKYVPEYRHCGYCTCTVQAYSTSTNVLVRQEQYGVKSSRYSTGCFYLIYSTVQPFMWFTVLLAPLSSHMYLNALYFYLYEHKVVIRLLVLVLVQVLLVEQQVFIWRLLRYVGYSCTSSTRSVQNLQQLESDDNFFVIQKWFVVMTSSWKFSWIMIIFVNHEKYRETWNDRKFFNMCNTP